MNLTLHHFRKEFRYLRLRWLAWLGALALQLAVDVEWLVPMRAGVESPGWLGLLPVLMWGGAVMLALGYAKEDARADDRSFIAVRPLSAWSYWWSRGLVFLLLIMAPLVMQEGLYLVVSGVGAKDVMLGIWERFFVTGAALCWLVPMPLIAGGGARWAVAGAAALTGLLAQSVTFQVLRQRQLYAEMFYGENSLAQAAWLGAGAMAMLAWMQKRGGWPLARTLTTVAGLVVVCFALAWTPWLQPWSWSAREPDLMTELEATRAELPYPHSLRILPSNDDTGKSVMHMDGDQMPLPAPAELLPRWRVRDATLTQKGEGTTQAKISELFNRRFFWHMSVLSQDNEWLLSSLPGAMAAETLSMAARDSSGRNACTFGDWPIPKDLQPPADIEVRLEADWLRQSVLGSCEVRPGAVLRTEYADMEVVEVQPHQNGKGEEKAGSLTIIFKLTKREIETGGTPFTFGAEMAQMLDAPAQQLFWQENSGATGEWQMRAMHRGRTRLLRSITYNDVLTPATGIREQDVPTLRFLLRKQDYAGTSRHRLSLKELDLREHLGREAWAYPVSCPRVADAPRAGFLLEFERIPKPAPDAGTDAVARFVADVTALSHALEWRHDLKKDGSVRHPGDDHIVADAVAPYLLRHPEVLTRQAHLFVSRDNPFVRELLDATVLLAGLPGVSRGADGLRFTADTPEKGVPYLLNDIVERVGGWTALAPAIETALQQRSVQPILAVHEKWRSQLRFVRSDDEWLDDLKKKFSVSSFWSLKGEEAREQARGLIRREYELTVPPVMKLTSERRPLAECAIAAGIEVALDRRLRELRFWDETKLRRNDVLELSMLKRLMGGKELELKWEEALSFLRRVRQLRAADFSYDAATITWKPISKP